MNNARATVIDQCFALAGTALAGRWSFTNSNEALFWLNCVLKIDPKNTAASLASARAYQYIASQPWWHNDVRLARHAAAKALAVTEGITAPAAADKRELHGVRGQIYSALGQLDLAERQLNKAIDIAPEISVGHYFLHFTNLLRAPNEDLVLPGLQKAVELAEAEGDQRRTAAALYFLGFANTLFAYYDAAIRNLTQAMQVNPGYGAANLALIAATGLARRKDSYKAVRSFKARYPQFADTILDYLWVDRSSSAEYHRLVKPMVDIVKMKLGN